MQRNLSAKEHWFDEDVTIMKRQILQDTIRGLHAEFLLQYPEAAQEKKDEEDDDEIIILD